MLARGRHVRKEHAVKHKNICYYKRIPSCPERLHFLSLGLSCLPLVSFAGDVSVFCLIFAAVLLPLCTCQVILNKNNVATKFSKRLQQPISVFFFYPSPNDKAPFLFLYLFMVRLYLNTTLKGGHHRERMSITLSMSQTSINNFPQS